MFMFIPPFCARPDEEDITRSGKFCDDSGKPKITPKGYQEGGRTLLATAHFCDNTSSYVRLTSNPERLQSIWFSDAEPAAKTSMIDKRTRAVSFLGLGLVFTVNMIGNKVLLGFTIAGTPGVSIKHCCTAMFIFPGGAAVGARMLA